MYCRRYKYLDLDLRLYLRIVRQHRLKDSGLLICDKKVSFFVLTHYNLQALRFLRIWAIKIILSSVEIELTGEKSKKYV